MHQMVAMFYEQRYLDLLDEGHQLDEPLMFTVAKGKPKIREWIRLGRTNSGAVTIGTPVPSHLMLVCEHEEWFYLQPSGRGLSLDGKPPAHITSPASS